MRILRVNSTTRDNQKWTVEEVFIKHAESLSAMLFTIAQIAARVQARRL